MNVEPFYSKDNFLKKIYYLFLDLIGVGCHADVVLRLIKDFLFKNILGQCTVPWKYSRTNAVVHLSRVLNVDM
jgi:hypothetical protein